MTLANLAYAEAYWQDTDALSRPSGNVREAARADNARPMLADIQAISDLVQLDNIDIELPLPDGTTAIFHLEYSPVAEQGLLDKFPEIRTFRGIDIDDANNQGRFDLTPHGFRGMFRYQDRTIFIDPQYMGDNRQYIVYYADQASPVGGAHEHYGRYHYHEHPHDHDQLTTLFHGAGRSAYQNLAKGNSNGTLRTYRLAVAATAEYTAAVGGSVGDAIAAITTAVNRITGVFENDLGISLQLVANNNLIVYTNAATDPYTNSDGISDLTANQSNINAVIGSANYDIGHLFSTGGGGVANLSVVCNSSTKARGTTGSSTPTGDAFYIDFVSHEMGHQFGAEHTFNGTAGNCGGSNRNASTAFEPGSGSTIMAYAGICGVQNLQSNSDAYFHASSIEEITNFVTAGGGASCGVVTNPVNAVPDVSAGPDVTIPANTPFVLTGSASDVDMGDTLTYVWEQMDAGTASSSQATMVDNGSRALFRSFLPSTSPTRYFPRLEDVIDGSLIIGEAYPTTNRNLNFRLTARDGSGATAFENKVVTVTTSVGPFELTFPDAGDVWTQGSSLVTWNVAGTNSAPVSCANVDIHYSSDGGATFPTQLASNVSNDGSQLVSAPTTPTNQGRIMVSCSDNVFFAVSSANFQISSAVQPDVSDINEPSVTEGGDILFNVILTATTTQAENYFYSLTNVTASTIDYSAPLFSNGVVDNGDNTITVPTGVSSFTVALTTIDDSDIETIETLIVSVDDDSATARINDNDAVTATTGKKGGGGGSLGWLFFIMLSMVIVARSRLESSP
ncbi:MAG: reprolysin-like metallopeptidase [Pseudomonadota bacterium]